MDTGYSEKQNQIIDAAEKLFAEKGYEGTSVRDIAHEAAVNIAMISYYFGSKEKLMHAIVLKGTRISRDKLHAIARDASLSGIEKMNVVIDDYVDRMLRKQDFHKIIMREQLEDKVSSGATMIYEMKKQNWALIKQLIHEGQQKGEFRKHIDHALMLSTLVGTCSHFLQNQQFYKEINNMEDLPNEEFLKHAKKKLTHHLKSIFKAALTYEA
jgi:AcrR family transcriptional regulator